MSAAVSEKIYEIMRRDADDRRADAYTAKQMSDQIFKDFTWIYSAKTIGNYMKAMAQMGLISRTGRHGYVINVYSRRYSWSDITLLRKYFPDQFKTLLLNQNKPGGADALQAHMDRARREEARANGESYAGLGGIVTRSGIFRGGRR